MKRQRFRRSIAADSVLPLSLGRAERHGLLAPHLIDGFETTISER
jgi:hypothetical protein